MKKLVTSLTALLIISLFAHVNAQQSYTFTNAGAIGKDGPTQGQLNLAYASTNLSGTVTSQSGIQRWVVPSSGSYSILANGAQGGGTSGGLGASMQGEFMLLAGDTLFILVGQEGGTTGGNQFSGGGGSYVIQGAGNNILVIAGGGGGATTLNALNEGVITVNGQNGDASGLGGTNGQGGAGASCRGGGGAGWLSAGGVGSCGVSGNGEGGIPFSLGGQGGGFTLAMGMDGGFGGGGSSEGINSTWSYCGGGGGYSGGGGGSGGTLNFRAGGAGSINNGLNQVNVSGAQSGNGSVTITALSAPAPNNAGVSFFANPQTVNNIICAGTASVDVVIQNYGANQINSLNIEWILNGVVQTTISYSLLLDTFGGAFSSTDTVTLGNISISSATDLVAYTSMPNGVPDTVNSNDTAALSLDSVININLDLGPDKLNCTGNFVFLENMGSSQVFSSYLWNNGSTSSSILQSLPGIYSLTVTYGPAPCIAIDSIEIIDSPKPTVDLGADFETCGDTIIDAQNAGNAYSWSSGDSTQIISVGTSGTYSVTVTTPDGCAGVDQINAVINTPPVVNLGEDFEICIDKNEASAIGVPNSPSNTYKWSTGATTSLIVVGSSNSTPGNNTFSLTVTDENGCSASDTVNIKYKKCLTGLSSLEVDQDWKVYPIPAHDVIIIEIDNSINENISIDIYDITGRYVQKLYTGSSNSSAPLSFDVSNLISGVYSVRLSAKDNVSVRQIVIK